MTLSFSDVPFWCVKRLLVPWVDELEAGLNLPFRLGGLSIPPLSAGCLSLMEVTVCRFIQTPENLENPFDILRPVYIAINREKCAELCFQHRAFEKDFIYDDESTYSPMDVEVSKLVNMVSNADLQFDNISKLWKFFNISFVGYSMIHGGDSGEQSEWLYGLDTLASYVKVMGEITNESTFDIIWRFPLALGSHMIAQAARINPDIKIYRPIDKSHLDRLHEYTIKQEAEGKLNFWQKMYPGDYDLTEIQTKKNTSLALEYNELRKSVAAMKSDERKARADEIFKNEGVV